MTKDAYFDMCDQLKIDPIEEDIPIDSSDFADLVTACIHVYSKLRDIWDPMGGKFLGKDYVIVFDLFNLYNITDQEEQLLAMEFLSTIDASRIKIVSDKIATETAANKHKKPR